ncbi:unnamed protein product [Onchocerca flexuosa]|uniref:Cytochrome oxidase subunit I n=1 Tax=Onchocerca flexuosa TaxID=387005 RepID=A0A183HFP5_9BILA|nr:unnamed protein product [Onchocerca flexuosa]
MISFMGISEGGSSVISFIFLRGYWGNGVSYQVISFGRVSDKF